MSNVNNRYELAMVAWVRVAYEYYLFVKRYKIEAVCILSGQNSIGPEMSVYVDKKQYANKLANDKKFAESEKQMLRLLNDLEDVNVMLYDAMDEEIAKKFFADYDYNIEE